MIVGTVAMKAPNLTPEEINVASAKNSREFFIGSKQSLVESYRPEIGTLNPLITDEEQQILFEKVIRELMQAY
jgi:hypothetical protein